MIDLSKLNTEQRNPKTMELDRMSPIEIATVMNEGDRDSRCRLYRKSGHAASCDIRG